MELALVVSNMLVLDSLGRPRDALDRGRVFTPPSGGPVSETWKREEEYLKQEERSVKPDDIWLSLSHILQPWKFFIYFLLHDNLPRQHISYFLSLMANTSKLPSLCHSLKVGDQIDIQDTCFGCVLLCLRGVWQEWLKISSFILW